ncbi:hypothetical protein RN001_007563 [Aquatica leii]|uniref:Very-long-chain (3R)-3-hydroxyacyl-CoA dehydratase n=1 Tax=Aquatica leii TaxID=1421715 RepID=A0AAN7P8H5_9COLE|nr:hypothetical protein RN001_007563 [Aquatica leii]
MAHSSKFAKFYLIAYNLVQTLGWSFMFYQLVQYYLFPKSDASLYDSLKCTLIIFQNAAILEIFHATFKLVPSSPVITMQQVFSRVMVVCGVLMASDDARLGLGLPLALSAWCITEIIRYLYYTLNLVNSVPYLLIWLRYTTFIILYPVGVTGELLCIYAAQNEMKQSGMWTVTLPNVLNFTFNYPYLLLGIMALYVPLFPQMYLHMFAQRRKILGGQPVSKATSAKKKNKQK